MTAKKVGSAGSSTSAAEPDYVEEGNLLGSLGLSPIPPETKAANEVLDLRFKAYMSKMNCSLSKGCAATGKFIKTGRDSNGRMRIKCTSCNATTTNVAVMIEKAGGPPAKSVATATPVNTESQAAALAELKVQNRFLLEQNKELKEQLDKLNDTLIMQTTQIAKLTEQVAVLSRPKQPSEQVPEKEVEVVETVPANALRRNRRSRNKKQAEAEPRAQEKDSGKKTGDKPETVTAPDKNPPQANKEAEQNKKLKWADVVRRPTMAVLPASVQEKFKKSAEILKSSGFKPTPRPAPRPQSSDGPQPQNKIKPAPVPVYFGGIPRGPVGKLRKMLRECLPKWSILNISFIGNSVTEILCHEPMLDHLVGGLKLLGYRHIPSYDPVREMNTDAATLRGRTICYQRWRWGAENAFSEVSRECFAKQMDGLAIKHPEEKQAADKKELEKQQTEAQIKDKQQEAQADADGDESAPNTEEETNKDSADQQRPEGETDQ